MFNLFDRDSTTDFEFLLNQIGSDVVINQAAMPVRAVITNTNLEQIYDDKKIATMLPLQRGDIVVYNGNKYMIISEANEKRYNKFKGIMRRLSHQIVVNSACRFYPLDCYINTINLNVINGQVLSMPDGEINVYISHSTIDSELKLSARFLLDGQAFKMTGIDTFSKPGIAILTCEKDQINPASDDLANGIAGGLSCSVDGEEPEEQNQGQVVITSNSDKPEEIIVNQSKQYIATVTPTDEPVFWSVFADDRVSAPDSSVFQVTETTGNQITIKALKYTHYIQLKVELVDDPSVFAWQRIKLRSLL